MINELIHGPYARPNSRRGQIARAARYRFDVAVEHAIRDMNNKLRLAYGVPYHEWAEALHRGARAVELLLEVYDPGYAASPATRFCKPRTPRCPPWATRRYRGLTA